MAGLMKVLVFNAGSSNLKGALWEVDPDRPATVAPPRVWSAQVQWAAGESPDAVFDRVLAEIPDIDVAGHRIVHGGARFRSSVVVDDGVRRTIAKLGEFAPQHNPVELAGIHAVARKFGDRVPQVAVFDTAFHSTMPEAAAVYPGPYAWLDRGIRRYGFHGISYRYVSRRTAEILSSPLDSMRLVICHLGNGASAAAIRHGQSIDTTMGFTPLDGLMMGTRPGALDPGILIYLVRHCDYTAGDLDRVLNKESGLKGLSGVSSDMREVLKAMEAGNARARLAFDVYLHRLIRELGGMIASLGGVDTLVFTGGIGENCAPLRERVCRQFEFLGVRIDEARNSGRPVDTEISTAASAVRVLVVATDEDWEIARECCRLVPASGRL
jgi:acetate kinase